MSIRSEIKRFTVCVFITGLFFALAFFIFTDPFAGISVVGDGELVFLFFCIISPLFLLVVGINVGKLNSYLIWAFPIYSGLLAACLFYSIMSGGAILFSVPSVLLSGIGTAIGHRNVHKGGIK